MNCIVDMKSVSNTKSADKPNEDLAVFEGDVGIGMVLDGVSRDKENGFYPTPSPAKEVTQLFSEIVLATAKKVGFPGLSRLQSSICAGNDAVEAYNKKLNHRFPAGTVGVVFSLEDGCLCYAYIGDCFAALIRAGKMRVFTESQTTMVREHRAELNSNEIRFDICNHAGHPYGYGVWDGNPGAMDFVKYGMITLLKGDVILIYTDGMAKIIENMTVEEVMNVPMDEMCDSDSIHNQDDRTCMRIKID